MSSIRFAGCLLALVLLACLPPAPEHAPPTPQVNTSEATPDGLAEDEVDEPFSSNGFARGPRFDPSSPAGRGLALIRQSQYVEAEQFLRGALNQAESDQERTDLKGLITATYYGRGMHREGLAFLCDAYAELPDGDHRFRFQAHAHIRALRLRDGREQALDAAQKAASACGNRSDFSPVWASIPLVLMERLNEGLIRRPQRVIISSHFDESDQDELLEFIHADQRGESTPFVDHAYYFMRLHAELILRYPDFAGAELAYAERARDALGEGSRSKLDEFIQRYPESKYLEDVLQKLSEDVLETEGGSAYARFIRDYRPSEDRFLSRAVDEVRRRVILTLAGGDFHGGHTLLLSEIESLRPFAVGQSRDATDDGGNVEYLEALAAQIETILLPLPDQTPTQAFAAAYRARTELNWYGVADAILEQTLGRADISEENRCTGLYLLGRRQQDKSRYQEMLRLCPRHSLADDAMTELALLQRYARIDYATMSDEEIDQASADADAEAMTTLRNVRRLYRNRNAVDNAMFHLARMHAARGETADAVALYTEIVAMDASARIAQLASGALGSRRYEPAPVPAPEQAEARSKLFSLAAHVGLPAGYTAVFGACAGQPIDGEMLEGYFGSTDLPSLLVPESGLHCAVRFTLSREIDSLRYFWADRFHCQFTRNASDELTAQSCTPASDAEAVAGRRWANFSGLSFANAQDIVDSEDGEQWRERLVVGQIEERSSAHRAGVRTGWALHSICGQQLSRDLRELGVLENSRTCFIEFSVGNGSDARLHQCRTSVTEQSIELRGMCRRKGTLIDWLLSLFGW